MAERTYEVRIQGVWYLTAEEIWGPDEIPAFPTSEMAAHEVLRADASGELQSEWQIYPSITVDGMDVWEDAPHDWINDLPVRSSS